MLIETTFSINYSIVKLGEIFFNILTSKCIKNDVTRWLQLYMQIDFIISINDIFVLRGKCL